jgi:hypothetical protein
VEGDPGQGVVSSSPHRHGGELAQAFDFLYGGSVRASSLRAPPSRTPPIPFTGPAMG